MPQIWLTYEEVSRLFGCPVAVARANVITHGWPRRRCRDGETRVKLPAAAAHDFMVSYARSAEASVSTDEMVASLRGTLTRMKRADAAEADETPQQSDLTFSIARSSRR